MHADDEEGRMPNARSYEVITYVGGSLRGKWTRSVRYPRKSDAQVCADENMRMGYPSLVKLSDEIDKHGLPEGAPDWWDFKTLKRKEVVNHD
jgi:hypothetical protein